jgi:hypothetical protein
MDAYLVVGNSNTRRASVVRSLSGCFNRSLRDILLKDADRPIRIYARVGALQETRTSPEAFIAEVARLRCEAALCCLSASAYSTGADEYPDARAYVARLEEQGWRIRAIAVLGQNAGGLKAGNLRQFPQAGTNPINVSASEVRALFGWR